MSIVYPLLPSAFSPMWQVLKQMCEELSTIHSQFVQLLTELSREIGEYNTTQKDKLKTTVSAASLVCFHLHFHTFPVLPVMFPCHESNLPISIPFLFQCSLPFLFPFLTRS